MTLFRHDPFDAHSGARLMVKIECDALTLDDWDGLARIAADGLGRFRTVVGVPRGGIPFATALGRYTTGDPKHPILIADDVLTTGDSMAQFREKEFGLNPNVVGIVAFARNPQALLNHQWIDAIWMAAWPVP